MSNGVIKTKEEAQDGKSDHADGTVQQDNSTNVYSFTNQSVASLTVGAQVTFDTKRDSNGDTIAYNVQARSN